MKGILKKDKKQKKRSKTAVFFRTFLMAFLIVVVLATPFSVMLENLLESNPGGENAPVLEEILESQVPANSPFYEAFTNSKRVNILALGVTHEGLTDTIMLVSLDTQEKRLDLIGIPRDTYYYRGPGYSGAAHHKINAAYGKDPVSSAKAVSETLMNIPINYYVVLSYAGVEKIVNAMGGVPMNIPFHMKYDDPYDKPPLHIDIPAGDYVLNGEEAVQFLRFRDGYPDQDIGRMNAQQQFLKSALKRCISLDLPKIASTAYDNIISDMKLRTVIDLAGKVIGIASEDIHSHTMPGKWVSPYIRPDIEGIEKMLTEIYLPEQVVEGN